MKLLELVKKTGMSVTFQAGAYLRLKEDAGSISVWLVFVLALAYLGVYGFDFQIAENVNGPISTSGDAIGHKALVVRMLDGSYFESNRMGYPFGSQLYDYPISDMGNLTAIGIVLLLGLSVNQAINVYYFTGYVLAFVSSQVLFRAFKIPTQVANALAFSFSLAYFHFARFNHLFLTWYWVIPIYIYLGLLVIKGSFPSAREAFRSPINFITVVLAAALPSFGVYYFVFGVITVAIIYLAALQTQDLRSNLGRLIFLFLVQLAGLIVNLGPSIIFMLREGRNFAVATRVATESDLAGFHPFQLFLPRPDHLYLRWSNFVDVYNQQPFVNENQTATLGLLAGSGFAVCLLTVAALVIRIKSKNSDYDYIQAAAIACLLFGTSGAAGTFIAYFVTPQIRSWNRISIEIALLGLLTLGIWISNFTKLISSNYKGIVVNTFAIALALIVLIDQVPVNRPVTSSERSSEITSDANFIKEIENRLPSGAAIFQMPIMSYPEVPAVYNLPDMALLAGFTNSEKLHWSYGTMKSREGDLFYAELSKKDLNFQIKSARSLGFRGIFLDTRGFEDKAQVENLFASNSLLEFVSHDATGSKQFYKFRNPISVDFTGLSLKDKISKAKALIGNLN